MEAVVKALKDIGVSTGAAEIYFYLTKKSPSKARGISRALGIERVKLYRALKELQNRGMVEKTFEYPASFVAVPFGKVLDLHIKARRNEATNLENSKAHLLSTLDLYQFAKSKPTTDTFMILEGKKAVQSKLALMIHETKKKMDFVTSGYGLAEGYKHGTLDVFLNHPLRNYVSFRILLTESAVTIHGKLASELFLRAKKRMAHFESRVADFGKGCTYRFLIKDEEEMLLSLRISKDEETSATIEDTSLWTNNHILVHAFLHLFEEIG
jgi:sugar-specific transcriptional regulator TrmB